MISYLTWVWILVVALNVASIVLNTWGFLRFLKDHEQHGKRLEEVDKMLVEVEKLHAAATVTQFPFPFRRAGQWTWSKPRME